MTLSTSDKQEIKDQLSNQEKYILEVISGDRKTHAIHFRNIDNELQSIQNKQETILLKIEQLNKNCLTCDNSKNIKDYQKKMKPYELLMDYKRVPFYTATILFLTMIWDKLPVVWVVFKTKILGL